MKTAEITLSDKAIRYIKRKGFTHIKVELEAQLDRNDSEEDEYCDQCDDGRIECEHDTTCQNCMGTGDANEIIEGVETTVPCDQCDHGYLECEDSHICANCDGDGYVRSGSGGMSDEYCQMAILNHISTEAREALTYGTFYNDGSVDSEYTFTLPIEAAKYIPEYIKAFRALGNETGHFNTDRAGMHMALMMDGYYQYGGCPNFELDRAKLANFQREMKKLMPALFFLASANHKSRELGYRKPYVREGEKYSAINIFKGGMEYRVFETCYDNPNMVLQFVEVMAKTLKFYGTTTIKRQVFTQFNFPETRSSKAAYVSRFFSTPEQVEALDRGLEYLKPDGVSIQTLKAQRHFKPNYNKLANEIKLRKQYIEFVAEHREQTQRNAHRWIANRIREAKGNDSIFDLTLNKDKMRTAYHSRIEGGYNNLSFERWQAEYLARPNIITIQA